MFGKKSLEERIEKIEHELNRAHRHIMDLENPYRFEIGDKVMAEIKQGEPLPNPFPIKYDGAIVGMKYKYHTLPPYHIYEARVNYYTIFNSASKTTHELADNWYQIELK